MEGLRLRQNLAADSNGFSLILFRHQRSSRRIQARVGRHAWVPPGIREYPYKSVAHVSEVYQGRLFAFFVASLPSGIYSWRWFTGSSWPRLHRPGRGVHSSHNFLRAPHTIGRFHPGGGVGRARMHSGLVSEAELHPEEVILWRSL
jgi:hypothetical protein